MPGLGNSDDPLLKVLQWVIRLSVRTLAVLMTLLIVLGVFDVGWMLFEKSMAASPRFVLSISDILTTFGAFMAVLIAIEIFVNIVMYIREDVDHVKIVVATALMAIARKVIIMDFENTSTEFVWATATVILATAIAYWLLSKGEGIQVKGVTTSASARRPPVPPSVQAEAARPSENAEG